MALSKGHVIKKTKKLLAALCVQTNFRCKHRSTSFLPSKSSLAPLRMATKILRSLRSPPNEHPSGQHADLRRDRVEVLEPVMLVRIPLHAHPRAAAADLSQARKTIRSDRVRSQQLRFHSSCTEKHLLWTSAAITATCLSMPNDSTLTHVQQTLGNLRN